MEQLATGLRACLAALGGIGLYFLGSRSSWWLVVVAVIACILIGLACLLGGRRLLGSRPVGGVYLMTGWPIALVTAGAATTCVLAVAAVTVGHRVVELDEVEADVIGSAIVAALTLFAEFAFLSDLQRGTGRFSAGTLTRKALAARYLHRFQPGTRAFEAVFEDRAHGSPQIEGWGFTARVRRANAIRDSAAPATRTPCNQPTPGATPT